MDVKYLKRVFFSVLTAVVSIALAAYLIYHLVLYFRNDIVTTTAAYAVERRYADCTGYLFREERTLTAAATGTVSPVYEDGSKVGIGTTVVNVYGSASDAETVGRITALEKQIAVLRDSSSGGDYSDIGQVNKKISALVSSVRTDMDDGQVSGALATRDELLVQMNRAQIIMKTVENFDAQIASLEGRIADLRAQLGQVSATVSAPQSGYYYSSADGCEETFGLSALETLTPASFAALTASVPAAAPASGTVGKLVLGYRWYLAVAIGRAQSEAYTAGRGYDIVFEDNAEKQLRLTLERVIFDAEEPEAVLVFCCTETPPGFAFLRAQRLRIIRQEYEGYQVPRAAVRIVDGRQGVYVLSGATVGFRRIKVLYETEDMLIVAPRETLPEEERTEYLDLNESVIIQGKELYDGKIIVG